MDTIVVCEGEGAVNSFYCQAIRKRKPGCTIITADSVEKTLDRLAGSVNNLRLAIIDGNLHGSMMSWDLAEKLRSMSYSGPIVYIGAACVPPEKKKFFTDFYRKGPQNSIVSQVAEVAGKYLG